jgi:Arc/MetJ-type ribon-helix-helix transcriptional regulator
MRPDEGEAMPRKNEKLEEKDQQVVVSVRFPRHLLDRIQAIAAVESTSANAVIRAGMEAWVRDRVASAEFRAACEAYIASAQRQVATALREPSLGAPGQP